MGCVDHITAEKYPRQGALPECARSGVLSTLTRARAFLGVVIRDDAEAPGRMMIKLDNGRVLLATECQWQPAPQ
jgi:hypothetical protein